MKRSPIGPAEDCKENADYLSPIYARDDERWRSRCIYCGIETPDYPTRDDLALLALAHGAGFRFVRMGQTHFPVCSSCIHDKRCRWRKMAVSLFILPRDRKP